MEFTSLFINVIENIRSNAEIFGLGLTLILGVLTQFFPIKKSILKQGKEATKITVYGWLVMPLMIASTYLAVSAHQDSQQEEKEYKDELKTRSSLLKDELNRNIGETFVQNSTLVKSVSSLGTSLAEVAVDINQINLGLTQLKTGDSDNLNANDIKDKIGKLEQKATVLEKKLNKTQSDLLEQYFYSYTVAYDMLDISSCDNSATKGFYWNLYSGSSLISERHPSKYKTKSKPPTTIEIKQSSPFIVYKNTLDKSPSFNLSGYIREFIGISTFKRNYLYRLPGKFSETIQFDIQSDKRKVAKNFEITVSDDNSCKVIVSGNIIKKRLNSLSQ